MTGVLRETIASGIGIQLGEMIGRKEIAKDTISERILGSTTEMPQTMPVRINMTSIEESPNQLQPMKMPHLEDVGRKVPRSDITNVMFRLPFRYQGIPTRSPFVRNLMNTRNQRAEEKSCCEG